MVKQLLRIFVKDYDQVDDLEVRRQYGLLSGVMGIVLNLLLVAGKGLAGVLSGSIAITADAFNNLSDAGTSVVTLVGFQLAAKEPDADHPFGHGRMEYLSGLLVALAILLVGVELGKSAIEKILHPQAVEFSWLVVGILAASILVKLWMCHMNRVLGRAIQSAAMEATAADSLSDVVATSAVLVGTLVGHFAQLNIDGFVGIIVAIFVLRAGWEAAKDTLDPLLGQSADPVLVQAIQKTVMSYEDITGIHDLVIHDYGPGRRMCSLHAEVPMDADMLHIHDVIDDAERALKIKFKMETVIHMDPIATHDPVVLALRQDVAKLVRTLHPDMTIHDFRMTAGPNHTNLVFDVLMPHDCPQSEDDIRTAIEQWLQTQEGTYYAVIAFDRAYA